MTDIVEEQVDKIAIGLSKLLPEMSTEMRKFQTLTGEQRADMLYDACVANVLKMTVGEAKSWIKDWFAVLEEKTT